LKVLFYNHTGQVSGAERVLLLILERLNRGRYAPVVICPAAGPLKQMVADLGVRCDEVDSLQARFTLRIDRLVGYLGSFWRIVRQLRREAIRVDPDLIHANSVRAGLVATAATIGLRVPVLWHVHDMLPAHPLTSAIRFVAWCSRRTRIIAVSNAVARRFRGNSKVILNAIDLEKFHPDAAVRIETREDLDLSRADQVIAIVGQITPRKGQSQLLEAFALVLKQIPQAILLVVGAPLFNRDEEYLDRLTQTAAALGITKRVRFLGSRSDVASITRATDLLVVNSLAEPFGLVVLEGMASGTPVLATAVDGIPEIINHAQDGWLVPAASQDALVSGIVNLFTQPTLRARLATRGLARVRESFTAERYMRELEEFYAEVGGKQSIGRTESLTVESV
jgi:glycosyltransferase involved in cell wall biosynthesis